MNKVHTVHLHYKQLSQPTLCNAIYPELGRDKASAARRARDATEFASLPMIASFTRPRRGMGRLEAALFSIAILMREVTSFFFF